MVDRLATTDMGQKRGLLCPFQGGSWVLIYYNVAMDEAYLRTKWHLDPSSRLVTTDIGRKLAVG